jgi:hypothetical protein
MSLALRLASRWNPPRLSNPTKPFSFASSSIDDEVVVAEVPALDSHIITGFPPISKTFQGKQFALLWRGTRDGFEAQTFHERCDRHSNTVTLIESDGGFIFGGFTPVPWESQPPSEEEEEEDDTCVKEDLSGRSFLFTLRNPSATPPKKFTLYWDCRKHAIACGRKHGPAFGKDDLWVESKCNQNTASRTRGFGEVYANNSGRDGKTFFTGMAYFTVREIEVFEISD